MRGAWQRWLYQDEHLLVELLSGCLGTSQDALSISSLLTFPPPLTLQVFIGCYYKSMTSIFSLSEDLSLCAPPTCFLIGDHHLIRVFSYTEGSLPCYIKRLEATWCELRYHYKQLKNTNCGKPDLGIQQNMQEVLNMCEAFFPPSYQNKAEKRPCKSPCFSLNI